MSEIQNNPQPEKEDKNYDELQNSENNATERALNEIHQENAEEAEHIHQDAEEVPFLDYEKMPLQTLIQEFKRLLHTQNLLSVKRHLEAIRHEFDRKYDAFLEGKKADFIADGNNDYEFKYESHQHKEFYALFNEYREKRNQHYKELEKIHSENLIKRREIIEEIKNLINTEEDINTTYRLFNQLQERWRKAGAVSYVHYNDLWSTYHHHVENFYDFISLSRDLRDIDFKRNLDEKLKLIEKAEALDNEDIDALKASRELNLLHRIWKEEIGPVAKEFRVEIWQKFSDISKRIHERKQQYFADLDKSHAQNANRKQEILNRVQEISKMEFSSLTQREKFHNEVVALRETFLNIGRVPAKQSDELWKKFKNIFRDYNHSRNEFFKAFKVEQQKNLSKKMALLEIAKANKDNTDWETITPVMKKIQEEWKTIGNVPKKNSEKLSKEFRKACNHYFDAMHNAYKNVQGKEFEALDKKKMLLDDIKSYKLSGDREKDLEELEQFVTKWNEIGKIPHSKRGIDLKFNKIIDAFYKDLNFDKQEIELIKYNNKLEKLANDDDDASFTQEMIFVRKKIDELKSEILQLENNLQFFSNVDEKNPIFREVIKNINNKKEALDTWGVKLRELKNMQSTQEESSEE